MGGHSGDLSRPTTRGWRRTIIEDMPLSEKPKYAVTLYRELPKKYQNCTSSHVVASILKKMIAQGLAIAEEDEEGRKMYRRAEHGSN